MTIVRERRRRQRTGIIVAAFLASATAVVSMTPAHAERAAHTTRVARAAATLATADTLGANFDGITSDGTPFPNANGAAGPSQYVEVVDDEMAVYGKSGSVQMAPRPTNSLWSGFGGGCSTNNDGQATVLYDTLAQRWVVQQTSVSTTPYLECVAVSTTGDATGSWYRYSFPIADLPDSTKMGVWPDGYYTSTDVLDSSFHAAGTQVCALDRASMLAGKPATQQCFMATTSGHHSLLPASVEGPVAPPAGEAEWFVGLSPTTANALAYWRLHVDWATPANSNLSAAKDLPVNAFVPACGGFGACIPQGHTTQRIDAVGDRLLYRLEYRNFGDHESIVATHAVSAGSSVGMRWYELRPSGTTLTVYQQGTYAPDSNYRWMGSVAMDRAGDMALGYNLSSASLYPGIAYTGRLASDPLGTMTQGESSMVTGAASQTSGDTWGTYSSMSIDPFDDCTFWYVNEYVPTATSGWATRIASFHLPSCRAVNDFAISASPSALTIVPGFSATTTISTSVTNGAAQTVRFNATGVPAGGSVSITPGAVTAGGSASMTVYLPPSTPAGTFRVTVTGTSDSATESTTLTVTVPPTGIVNGGFEAGSLSGWTSSGSAASTTSGVHSGTFAGVVGASSPTNGDSSIRQSFTAPYGSTLLSFWYDGVCPDSITYDWSTATLTDNTTNVSSTPMPKTCVTNSGWQHVVTPVTPGHTYTLTLTNHDDNYPGDATYTIYDDVTLTNGGVINGGFETGTRYGWISSGTTAITTSGAHSGGYFALIGARTPTSGDSFLRQSFTAPTGASSLSFWYFVVCPDTVSYDWATATLVDNSTGASSTPLPPTCVPSSGWHQVTAALVPGHSYTLTLISHDDNYPGDATYTAYDDVTVA